MDYNKRFDGQIDLNEFPYNPGKTKVFYVLVNFGTIIVGIIIVMILKFFKLV